MPSPGTSAFTPRVDKDEEKFLQTFMPQYELCQVEKKYVTFWKLVIAAHAQAFPFLERLWPGESRTLKDLSLEESEWFASAMVAKQNSIKEWFRWRTNPRSRNTSNSVSKKDIQKIFQPGRRRGHKEYEIFAKLYPGVFNPVYEEACRIQGATGRKRLPVYHKVAARLWREAASDVRSAVQKQAEAEQEERESELEKIELGEGTPESYQHFQAALPGILTTVIDPAVRRAGMIAVCTMIGPVPEAGGQIMATTLQFGDSPDTPLFSQAWLEHDKSFVEALAQFAVKYEFPEELCSKRSLMAAPDNQAGGEQVGDEPTGSPGGASQPPAITPPSTEVLKKGKSAASSLSKQPSKVSASRPKEISSTTSKASTPVPAQTAPPLASSVPGPSPIPSVPPASNPSPSIPSPPQTSNSSTPNPTLSLSAPGGSPPNGASAAFGQSDRPFPHQPPLNQLTPGALVEGPPLQQPSPNQLTPGVSVDAGILPSPNLSTLTADQLSRALYHDSELLDDDLGDFNDGLGGQVELTWGDLMNGFDPTKSTTHAQSDPDVWANLNVLQSMSGDANINFNPDVPSLFTPFNNTPLPDSTSGMPDHTALPSFATNSNQVPPAAHQTPALAAPSSSSALEQAPGAPSPGLWGGSFADQRSQSMFAPPSQAPQQSWFAAKPLTSTPHSSAQSASSSLTTLGSFLPAGSRPSAGAPLPSYPSLFRQSPLGLNPPISASQSNQNPTPNPALPHSTSVNPSNALPAPQPPSPSTAQPSDSHPAVPGADAAPGAPPRREAPATKAEPPKAPPVTARSSLGIPSFTAQRLSQDKPTPALPTPGATPEPAPGANPPQPTPGASPPLLTPTLSSLSLAQATSGAVPPLNGQSHDSNRPRPKPRIRVKSKKTVESPPPEDLTSGEPSSPCPPPPQITTPPLHASSLPPPSGPPPQQDLVDTENNGTRRSARPVVKNTWLEKQNLIGTNIVSHPQHPTSTAETSEEIPLWFLAAVEYFKTGDLGDVWVSVLERWALLERSLGFGKVGKTPLPVQNRPEEWQKWTAKAKNGVRAYDKIPVIEEPAEFGSSILNWWSSLQPGFRLSADTGALLPVYCDDTFEGDAWATIRKSGPNGFVSFMTLLDWWGRGANSAGPFKDDSRPQWAKVVLDVGLCLDEMLKPAAKRPVATGQESEPSNKRQRVK